MPGFGAALVSVVGMEMESRAKLASEQNEALPSDEIKRRIAEKAALLAELEARNPKPTPEAAATPEGERLQPISRRITVDARRLSGLASRAKKLERIAEAAHLKATEAKASADVAREELNAYMRETGLA